MRLTRAASVFSKIIPYYLAPLHYEADVLQFRNICDGVPGDADQIGKLPWLNRAHSVLPSQHFGSVNRDGTNHIKSGCSSFTQTNKGCDARLSSRLARIRPTHVGSSRKFHARLQYALNQLVVPFLAARRRTEFRIVDGR